ncbi:ABC transporter substrate-binding protein [Natrinema salifodinae]|uniref:Peptide/nickel transport system substrate-binding protein n=1 Tax=Natrinema salifodinae TaxID=1202768 RepID=A0A1I0NAE0_9EURY|nr:ABC transporter substrate-binding protein [Natrinema salifodinae]SEV97934.1 peptide/nickel transport system substrate-binding protein [Natrinema salifodinae]
MNSNRTPPDDGVSRRSVLAAGAAGAATVTSGCVDRVRSVVDQNGDDQISLSIATVPADADRQAVQIARRLEANLEAVGINVSLDMRSRSELLEAVLIEHDFDLYVGRHPADYNPDFLYESLHSTFAGEAGWQNPFGVTGVFSFDTDLERWRTTGEIAPVLRALAEEKPFDPICFPREYRVARTDRFTGWEDGHLATRHGYLGLESADDVEQLHALVTDARVSTNLNPLSATVRERGTTIDLLYDSLVTERDGEIDFWLAKSVDFLDPDEARELESDPDGDSESDSESPTDAESESEPNERQDVTLTANVTLREGCTFHDGEPVTAADVAFTYQFLQDTALGRANVPSPAPRYRGHVDAVAVEGISIEDDYELMIPVTGSEAIAERALTVPILPAHIWRERVDRRTANGELTAPQGRWAVVTTDNIPPVGSGPYQFENRAEDEHLTLRRFEDHFTLREDVELPQPTVEELRFSVDPSSASAVERIANGGADVTASMLKAYSIGAIPDSSDVTRVEPDSDSRTFYFLGFNVREAPFTNTLFRRAVTRLLDKQAIVEEVFYGDDYATPTATPVTEEWVPPDLEWNGEDPVTPFLGTDGELNVEAAKATFERAYFRYDDNGRLLGGY